MKGSRLPSIKNVKPTPTVAETLLRGSRQHEPRSVGRVALVRAQSWERDSCPSRSARRVLSDRGIFPLALTTETVRTVS